MKKGRRTPGGVSVHVKGRNIAITPALHDLVVHKMHRLDKYLDRLDEIEVELGQENTRAAPQQHHVEAATRVLGKTLRVKASHPEMASALDQAVDRLYRQLNRTKERIKAHHGAKLAEVVPVAEPAPLELPEENVEAPAVDGGHPVILIEPLDMKPQFEDDAIEEMEALGHSFYVFLNARNEHVNVLYRRRDGAYGLIEPRIG